jgi:hypothetical protein
MAKLDLKETMKQSLGGKISPPVKQSIYDATIPETPAAKSPRVSSVVEPAPSQNKDVRPTKAEVYTERVTLVINSQQRDLVEDLAKTIQRNGLKKPERITANTVMRCLIDLLEEFDADVTQVVDEDSLKILFKDYFINPSK